MEKINNIYLFLILYDDIVSVTIDLCNGKVIRMYLAYLM